MVLGSKLRRGSSARGRTGRTTALAAVAVLVIGPAAAACGDDSGGNKTAPSAPYGQSSTSRPATAPADPAAAEKEIRRNWQTFFDPSASQEDKEAVLENGPQMRPVMQAFSGDQRGKQVQAKVEKVTFTSPTEADVTYSLTMQGQTALPGAKGTAVEQDDTWKVSVKTLCALVQLSGNASASAIPGC